MQLFGVLVTVALIVAWTKRASAGPVVRESYGTGAQKFSLATASPGELGLLGVLGQAYCSRAGCRLDWVKAGSGRSLDLLKAGEVDMVMVHAPDGEKRAVAEGWAGRGTLIGSNEFFLVGPRADPAGVATAGSAADAYRRIAAAGAEFFSRGDDSGTHKKEMAVWKAAGIEPAGDWYVVTREFMTATLRRANDAAGYFMTDSSTWVAEKKHLPNLAVLFSGDPALVNTYHALCRLENGRPTSDLAVGFIDFAASPEGQNLLGSFGRDDHGEALYNDAAYARRFEEEDWGAAPDPAGRG